MQTKGNRQITVNSFTYALVICMNFWAFAFGEILGTGGMVAVSSMIVACLFVNILYVNTIKVSVRWLFMASLLVAFYQFSPNTDLEKTEFFCYIVVSCIAALYAVDTEKVLRYVTYFSVLLLVFTTQIFAQLSRQGIYGEGKNVMGLSYAILPIVIAGLTHFIYYRKKANFLLKICYVTDTVYTFILFMYANRGVVLTLLVVFVLLYIKKFGSKSSKKNNVFRVIVVLAVAIFVANNYMLIFEWLNNILLSFGIKLDFIQKTLRLKKDISNGRDEITQYVVENIFKSPLWGHGISVIRYNTNGVIDYPHNFILQLFYDGGILLAVPVLYFVIKMLWHAIWGENNDKTILLVFFCLTCLPKMFFSTNMWENPSFWLLLFNYIQFDIGNFKIRKKQINIQTQPEQMYKCGEIKMVAR